MNPKVIFRNLLYFSVCLFLVTALELVFFILFNIIQLDLGVYILNIISLVFTSGFVSIHVILAWLLLLISICGFLIFSVILIILSVKKNIKDKLLAKYFLLIGLFFLLSGFIKLSSIFIFGNSIIRYNGTSIVFQNALYTDNITPFIGGIMWIYFTAISSGILISGLIFGGIGLKSMLNMERKS